jgi:hypothetical protein
LIKIKEMVLRRCIGGGSNGMSDWDGVRVALAGGKAVVVIECYKSSGIIGKEGGGDRC